MMAHITLMALSLQLRAATQSRCSHEMIGARVQA